MIALRRHSRNAAQGGFAIVSAIFLLIVLAALGAFMLTLSSSQQLTSAEDVQGSRNYWTAKAGVQWAADRIKAGAACANATTSFALEGFTVTVDWKCNSYVEGTASRQVFWVTSTATAAGGVGSIGFTERVINAFIEF